MGRILEGSLLERLGLIFEVDGLLERLGADLKGWELILKVVSY